MRTVNALALAVVMASCSGAAFAQAYPPSPTPPPDPPIPVSCGGYHALPTTAPAVASAAGFTTLFLGNEFNADTEMNGSGNWQANLLFEGSGWVVDHGCLLIITDYSGFSEGFKSTTPIGKHGYFEARYRYDARGWQGPKPPQPSGAWPAFWMANKDTSTVPWPELDVNEGFPFSGIGNYATPLFTAHEWTSNTPTLTGTANSPNFLTTYPAGFNPYDFHTYGALWKTTGTGTASVTWFIDGSAVLGPVNVGAGTSFPTMEAAATDMVLFLGTGWNWPVVFDWVHVWR